MERLIRTLDPNYYRQLTPLIVRPLSGSSDIELRLFWAKASPPLYSFY